MTYFILAAMAALTLILLATVGARKALWIIWPLGFLLAPSWASIISFGGLPFSSQLMPLLLLPALFLGVSREKNSPIRWCLADILMLLMLLCQNISEAINGTYSIMTTPGILMLWGAPYIIGRLYLRSEKDLNWALWPLTICITILCSCILLESLTGINPFRAVMGLESRSEVRVGLHRASGAMNHPIHQGVILVLVSPLAIEAAARARKRSGPIWWIAVPWILLAAVIGTVSRGPMAACLATMAIYVFFRLPSLRIPLALLGTVAAAVMVLAPDTIKSGLFAISGEDKFLEENDRTIVIDGEDFQYSGTDHRWMLYHAYARPLANAGLFGYGYGLGRKTSLIEEDFQDFNRYFYSIDNNTINHILTYGYLGLTLFLLLPTVAILYLAIPAWNKNTSLARLSAGLIGALLTVNLALFTVGMTRSYLSIWPFVTALAVTVAQLARAPSSAPAVASNWQSPPVGYLPWRPAPKPSLNPQLMPQPNTGQPRWHPG